MRLDRAYLAKLSRVFLSKSGKNVSYEAALLISKFVELDTFDGNRLIEKMAFSAKNLWPNKPLLTRTDIEFLFNQLLNRDKGTSSMKKEATRKEVKSNSLVKGKALKGSLLDFLVMSETRRGVEILVGEEKRVKPLLKPDEKKLEEIRALNDKAEKEGEVISEPLDLDFGDVEKTIAQKESVASRLKIGVLKTVLPFQIRESYEVFQNMFSYRFNKLKEILIKKGLGNIVTSAETKKLKGGEERHIIVMVYEKRLVRGGKGGIIIGEDDEGFVTIYVPLNGDLARKFQRVLLDSVIAVRFNKISNGMILCEDIVFPGPNKARKRNVTNEPMKMIFISDLHVGSKQFLKKHFENFIKFVNGDIDKPWVKKIVSDLKIIGIVGDLVDGVGVYPNQKDELEIDVIYDQFDMLYNYLSDISDDIEIIAIPGNHDPAGKFIPQPPIPNEFLGKLVDLPNFHSLGNPSLISIDGVKLLLYHGQGLEDIASALSIGIKEPTLMMVEELRNLHLLPMWGEKSLVPLEYDPLIIEEVPDIYVSGHLHHVDARITTIGSSLLLNASTFQGITSWQIKMGIEPTPGIFPIVELPTYNVHFIRCDEISCYLLSRKY